MFDFTGTGPEMYGNRNAPRAITFSAIIYCLRCMVKHDIPLNQVNKSQFVVSLYFNRPVKSTKIVLVRYMLSRICFVLKKKKRLNYRVWLVFSSGHLCVRFELTILQEPDKRVRLRRLKRKKIIVHTSFTALLAAYLPRFFSPSGLLSASAGNSPTRQYSGSNRNRSCCWWECVDQSESC